MHKRITAFSLVIFSLLLVSVSADSLTVTPTYAESSWGVDITAYVEDSDNIVTWERVEVQEWDDTLPSSAEINSAEGYCEVQWYDSGSWIGFKLYNGSSWSDEVCLQEITGAGLYECDLKNNGIDTPEEANNLYLRCTFPTASEWKYYSTDWVKVDYDYEISADITISNEQVSSGYVIIGENIDISANVTGGTIDTVKSTIILPDSTEVEKQMYLEDNIYKTNYTAQINGPHQITIFANNTEGKNATKELDFTAAKNHRVAIVFSNTTRKTQGDAGIIEEILYTLWLGTAQHHVLMAGIPYDIIDEEDLTDVKNLKQYDALIFPYFYNVKQADRTLIKNNLKEVVTQHNIGIIAAGVWMSYNESNNYVGLDAMNEVLNIDYGGFGGGPVTLSLNVTNSTHPALWRYNYDDSLTELSSAYYDYFKVHNSSKKYDYIANISDKTTPADRVGVIATENGGKVVHIATPSIAHDSMIIRDSLKWILFGNNPQPGVKITKDKSIFSVRVDADVSSDEAQTETAISNFIDLMSNHGLMGSWYIVTNHSGTGQVNWTALEEDYLGLLSSGHEISSHSKTHPSNMNTLTISQMDSEMQNSKSTIDAELNINITGFANPGEADRNITLYERAEIAGYLYYGILFQENVRGIGFIEKGLNILGIQNNVKSDFYWISVIGKNDTDVVEEWKEEFDSHHQHEDGIIISPLWHDYYLDEKKPMFSNISEYASGKGAEGIPLGNVSSRIRTWLDSDFTVVNQGSTTNITRIDSNAKYGQLVFPKNNCLAEITGHASYTESSDRTAVYFEFSSDEVSISFNETC